MPLWIQNLYNERVYVALLWFDGGCSPDPWRKRGWWTAGPGEKVEVMGDDLRDLPTPVWGWFAVADNDGGPWWSGDHWYDIPRNFSFSQCFDDDTGCNASRPFVIGRFSESWLGFTLILLAPGAPDQPRQGCAWGSPQFPPEPPPPNMGGPNTNMGGPNTNMGGPNTNMGGPNYNFTTGGGLPTFVNTILFSPSGVNSPHSPKQETKTLVEIVEQSIQYFDAPWSAVGGQLVVVGAGIRAISDMTLDAEAQIRIAQKVLYCVADPVTERRLHALNASATSLYGLYANDKPRIDTYREMLEAILSSVRAGLRVCVVFYGHPGVFAWSTHEAVRAARREGFRAEMHAGISADAALFADLGIDPSHPGCHSLEATDLLIRRRTPDVTAHLLLWQVECVGDFGFNFAGYERHNFHILIERLREFYPTTHPVIIYKATQLPQGRPRITKSSLDSITKDDLTGTSTLYLPPAETPEIDRDMCQRLGIWPSTQEPQ